MPAGGRRGGFLDAAMTAHRAGRLADADSLYRRALEADPRNARAARLRGILAREQGALAPSARYLARAVELAPDDPEPRAELALTCMAAGDLDGAEQALRAALDRVADHGKSLANLGALLQYRGRLGAAIECHERALALAPHDVEVRCNLVRALAEAGRAVEALALCEAGLVAAPGLPALLAASGAVYLDLGDFDAAAHALEGAVVRFPDDDLAWVNLAYVRVRRGEHGRAVEALRAALRANPDGARATADLVNLLAGTGGVSEALALAADFLAAHPGERHVLAAQAYALRDAGREAESAALLDLEQFIRVDEPAPPAGFATAAQFHAHLCRLVESDASLTPGPPGKATRGGFQTGELDLTSDPALAAFGCLIGGAVRDAAAAFAAAGLGAHPLMAYAAPEWSLRVWGTVLEAGGHQAAHIHPLGWLSGVYYLQVPADMDPGGVQAGSIEFGAPPERFLVSRPPTVRRIAPRPGRLVLFPSYFYHRTLPFAVRERRISIAFDVVPRAAGW